MVVPVEESSQSLALVISKGKGRLSSQSQQSFQNPPILRTSSLVPDVLEGGWTLKAHKMFVDKVTLALASHSHSSGDSDCDMSDSEEREEEDEALVVVELEEPDDLMTLDQYQSNFRKEALSRKSIQQ